jgi:hypothetical protein
MPERSQGHLRPGTTTAAQALTFSDSKPQKQSKIRKPVPIVPYQDIHDEARRATVSGWKLRLLTRVCGIVFVKWKAPAGQTGVYRLHPALMWRRLAPASCCNWRFLGLLSGHVAAGWPEAGTPSISQFPKPWFSRRFPHLVLSHLVSLTAEVPRASSHRTRMDTYNGRVCLRGPASPDHHRVSPCGQNPPSQFRSCHNKRSST